MATRASASSSSGQPSQHKRPCLAPTGCEEEPERAKSNPVEYCQSCSGNALKDIVQLIHSMEKWMHSMDKRMHSMENSIQELKEAVESANSHTLHLERGNAKSTANNGARNLQLQLPTKLSLPLFTGMKIEGEEGARINVTLIDANTWGVVTSGPESSIKLDVVVLEGDFNKDNEDNWAPEEFENCVIKEREGKGPLLAGDLVVKLKGGVGELGELKFTDNSSWTRSKRFRLGLKVASGFCGNTRIREAKTDAFPVKEHRGEAYRKHHPPASDDKVWRLEKIAKDGTSHHKLSKAGICTVEDFLLQLFMDAQKLRKILGKSITQNKWDSLICHAKTCKTKWKLYWDYPDGVTKHGAVFNTDGQLIGLVKDGEYFAAHRLSAQEKENGDTIVKKALANWNDVKEFSCETFSDSMQKNSSSSFSSQVRGGQIESFNPVQRCLAPPIFAASVGPEAPLANVGSTAEGLKGATALALPVQSPITNSGNSMEITVDESFCLAAHRPMSADCSNVLIPPGYHGRTTAGSPTQCVGINLQNAMHRQMIDSSSQMDYTGYDNGLSSEPSDAPISSFQSSRTLPLPEGNHVMGDFRSIDPDDVDGWFAANPPYNDTFDHGIVRGTGRGVNDTNVLVLSPGHSDATALALPIQLQYTNSGNAMKLSVDEIVRLAALQPISTDRLNVLIPQGDNGSPTIRLPIQSHGNNFQYAMRSHTIHSSSQTDYVVNENAPLSETPSAAISRFQSSGTLPPPEGNHMKEDLQPLVSANMDYGLALLSQSPPHDGGSVRGTSKGVHGQIKLKAVMRLGIFVRKIATTRRVGIVQLDEPPIEDQA